jgi:WD40 repeat protein
LLSLTLARLYEDYGGGTIGLADYQSMGGIRRVVESEIDAVLSSDPHARHDELSKLHDAFIPWLATVNPENDQPLRRPARVFDLPAESHNLIDRLVAKRLLVKDERDGDTVVEVALESLLRQWETLAGWLRDEAADLKGTDALELAARAWEDNGRRDDWLLEGARLTESEALAAKPGFRNRLNAASDYLLASRQREERRSLERVRKAQESAAAAQRHSHRLRAALAMVAVVAVAAVLGFGWALKARSDAGARFRDATAQRLFAQSQQMLLGQQTERSDAVAAMQMLLAARAIPSSHQGETYQLLTALNQQRDLLKVITVPAQVLSVAYSADGSRIVGGSADNTVRRWDATTGQAIGAPLKLHQSRLHSVAFSPDGRDMASGSADNTVRFWNSDTGEQIWEAKHDSPVSVVAFSPDGTRIASGSTDGMVRLGDVESGESIWWSRQDDIVGHLAFSPDGTHIVTGDWKGNAQVWDARTGQAVGDPIHAHDGIVLGVAYSPDGKRIATGSTDGSVRLWDAETRQPIGRPLSGGNVTKVTFSPDGRRIATASANGEIELWEVTTGRLIGNLSGHPAAVEYVAFSPDSRRLVSGGDDGTIRIWDVQSWQPMSGHNGTAFSIFSDDGTQVFSGSMDGTVQHWDAATGYPIGPPVRVADNTVDSLEPVGPDRLLSLSKDIEGLTTIRLWDTRRRTPVGEPVVLPPSSTPQLRFALSDNADKAAMLLLGEIHVLDADTMRSIGHPIRPESAPVRFEFSPDVRTLATSHTSDDDQSVRLWDVATGRPVGRPMTGNGGLPRMSFSPDGHLLAVAGTGIAQPGAEQNTLRVWDTGTFEPVGDPITVDSSVRVTAISPDDRIVAAGSSDGTIRLWDVDSQNPLGAPNTGHTGAVTTLKFNRDGTKLLSASEDHTVRMWPVPPRSPDAARDALCAKLTQNMSRDKWNEVVSPEIEYIELCDGLPEADTVG